MYRQLWQIDDLVAKTRKGAGEALIFFESGIHAMAAVGIVLEDLGPRRRQEHLAIIAMRVCKRFGDQLTADMFQGHGCVDQPPIEENPALLLCGLYAITQ